MLRESRSPASTDLATVEAEAVLESTMDEVTTAKGLGNEFLILLRYVSAPWPTPFSHGLP